MHSKYQPLTDYLALLGMESWRPCFRDIERILDFDLPKSHQRPEWWANGGHSHAQSWLIVGFMTQDLDLDAKKVTFRRSQVATPTSRRPSPASQSKEQLTHEWDVSGEFRGELCLSWTHVGAVVLDSDRHLVFPVLPQRPGLYRMRIRPKDGREARYVGETDNLRRRFGQYRKPGRSQETNKRINPIIVDALKQDAEVAVSIVTDQAWISQSDTKQAADFSRKAVRRMFENFVQVVEGDEAVEDLNR